MNIKNRLSFRFTLMVLAILFFFSLLLYYFSYTSQKMKFRENLLKQAQNTAILLINVEEVDSVLLKKIQKTTRSLEEEEIVITDSLNHTLYFNGMDYLKDEILVTFSAADGPHFFSIGKKDGLKYRHQVNKQFYHVYVLAYDSYGNENLQELRKVLFWCVLVGIWLSVSASYFFSRSAIKPISDLISSVRKINSTNLGNRLDEGRRTDEIEQLAMTFNSMLTELEMAFRRQDEFVSNASHELRTPLAVMIAESDYVLSKHLSGKEYFKHIKELVSDLRKLNQLINGLLELAHLNRNNNILFEEMRIDEPVMNAFREIKTKYPERRVLIFIDYPENEENLLIKGNQDLLEMVFRNIIGNALKFSEKDVDVKVIINERSISVRISDLGIGIPSKETEGIFKPFERGSNARFIGGYGIGLSIVRQIMELHSADIKITSIENEGTTIDLIFPKKMT